ncbi:MAG TPA: carbohydrate ABC transporter permease [Ruminococcus sp.]|nr:carbohydrate ABC transporter permease [Ruminococcus sp.]
MKKKVLTVFLTIYALFSALLFLFPTVLTIANSFMSSTEITSNYGMIFQNASSDSSDSQNGSGGKKFIAQKVNLKLIPDKVTFSQYVTSLFKSPEYLLKFWNSVILTVPIVIFQLAVASIASYSFFRFRGRIKEIVFFLYIAIMLMPYQVMLVPNYLVADKLGILGTRLSIILPGIFSPFSVFLLTKIMRRIPVSLIEAARLDGAGEWQIFTQICMPLCKNALISVGMLVFIDYWNMVEQPIIMLDDSEKYPLSVFLSEINTGEIGIAFAVAVIYMIPTILMFLYGEDYLVEGITYAGGVKG